MVMFVVKLLHLEAYAKEILSLLICSYCACAEGFATLLENGVQSGELQGIRICRGAPAVHYLLFADDSLLFGVATKEECETLNTILHVYEAASGQQINLSKSNVVFSKSVPDSKQVELAHLLGMNMVEKHDKYLGLPTYIGRKKTETFAYLRERLDNKLLGWQGKLLSAADKELLIRVVAQTLPSYDMSLFLLPVTFCQELEQKMAKFWWGSTSDDPKIHWRNWEKMCVPKEEGGLGFWDLHLHNLELLGKQVWRLSREPTSLAYQLLRARYFPYDSIINAPLSDSPSDVWRSLHAAIDYVKKGSRWQVGNGASIQVMTEKWVPSLPMFQPSIRLDLSIIPPARANEYIINHRWNIHLLSQIFEEQSVQAITQIPISIRDRPDRVVWHHEVSGQYTVKSGYKMIYEHCRTIRIPHDEELVNVRKKIWFANVPGKVKIHWWKVCSGILPTMTQLAAETRFYGCWWLCLMFAPC